MTYEFWGVNGSWFCEFVTLDAAKAYAAKSPVPGKIWAVDEFTGNQWVVVNVE
jgi:hypothetical protein